MSAFSPTAPVTFIPEKPSPRAQFKPLRVVSEFEPSGDQPAAIEQLVAGIVEGERDQVPVSYTHLDVYKRQIWPRRGRGLVLAAAFCASLARWRMSMR